MSVEPRAKTRWKRVLWRNGLALAGLVAVLIIVDFVFHGIYIERVQKASARIADEHLPHLIPPPGVTQEEFNRVGWIFTDKRSAFTGFPEEKPPGVFRVGCFGGSYTYGGEVNEGNDYPTQLQELFDDGGTTKIEVLNFGNPWYGMHQTYLLWESVGKRYDLDCILLGPACFTANRDTAFNHSSDVRMYTLHARYVLDGDDVRLVEVAGEELEQRIESYYAFLPRLRYLRYDRQAPIFLRCLLREGRELANPFYYTDLDPEDEALETWRHLISRMAASGVPILVTELSNSTVVSVIHELDLQNVQCMDLDWIDTTRFPNRTGGNHLSGVGNRLLAKILYAVLTGELQGLSMISTTSLDVHSDQMAGNPPPVPRIGDYPRISFEFGDQEAGLLYWDRGRRSMSRASTLKWQKVRGLVILQTSESLLDGLIFPLEEGMGATPEAVLAWGPRETENRTRLGAARRLHPALDVWTLDLSAGFRSPPSFDESLNLWSCSAPQPPDKPRELMLRVGGQDVSRLEYVPGRNRVIFRPVGGRLLVIRGNAEVNAERVGTSSDAVCSLVLYSEEGEEARIPVARGKEDNLDYPEELREVSDALGTAAALKR